MTNSSLHYQERKTPISGHMGKGKLPLASAENRGRGYHIPGDTGQSQRENCHAEVRTTRLRASWASILPPSCSSRPDSISSHWVTESERSPRPYRQVPILKSHQRKLRFKEDTRLPPRPTSHVSTCHTSHVSTQSHLYCACAVCLAWAPRSGLSV